MNDHVLRFEVTVRNLVLMQKGHAFDELKTERHIVVGRDQYSARSHTS